jgi:GNAT superfamily N-acetyltransferase
MRRVPTLAATVRPMQAGDLDAVLALWGQAAQARGGELAPAQRDSVAAHLRHSLGHPRMVLGVCLEGGRLLGYVTAHTDVHPTMNGAWGILDELFVHPSARRQGAGTALVEAARERLTRKGVADLRAEVHPADADALAFFAAVGFGRGAVVLQAGAPA